MTGQEQTAVILVAIIFTVSVVGIVAGGAYGDPGSRLHRPARMFFAVFDHVGRLGPVLAGLGAILVLSQCNADAYRAGYEAHVMECLQSIAQCRGGKVP